MTFEALKIADLTVVDARGRPVGLIDGQDLPKLKIVLSPSPAGKLSAGTITPSNHAIHRPQAPTFRAWA